MIVMNLEQKINDVFIKAAKIEIFENGTKRELNNAEFEACLKSVLKAFEKTRISPAFGVSLHEETLKATNSGSWIQISFKNKQMVNDLPFDALLFRLDNCYGLNLIRLNENRYDGRCIYIDFENLTNLAEILNF